MVASEIGAQNIYSFNFIRIDSPNIENCMHRYSHYYHKYILKYTEMGNKRSKLAEPRFLSWHESADYATGILERIAKEVHVSSRDTNSVNANIHRRMGRSFSDDRAATGTPENIDKRSIISRNKRLEDFLHEVLNVIHVYGVHSEEMGKYSIGFYFDDNSIDHHRVCVTFCLSDGVGIFDNVEDREDIKLGKKRFRYSRCLNNKRGRHVIVRYSQEANSGMDTPIYQICRPKMDCTLSGEFYDNVDDVYDVKNHSLLNNDEYQEIETDQVCE